MLLCECQTLIKEHSTFFNKEEAIEECPGQFILHNLLFLELATRRKFVKTFRRRRPKVFRIERWRQDLPRQRAMFHHQSQLVLEQRKGKQVTERKGHQMAERKGHRQLQQETSKKAKNKERCASEDDADATVPGPNNGSTAGIYPDQFSK